MDINIRITDHVLNKWNTRSLTLSVARKRCPQNPSTPLVCLNSLSRSVLFVFIVLSIFCLSREKFDR